MTPERWKDIAALYRAALDLPDSDRGAFLRANCGGDESLRLEVESLLSISERRGLLDLSLETEQFEPSTIVSGRFRIVRLLGQGGMGVVYEAEDLHLGGRVALKTIRPEIALTAKSVERFKREILAARKVTHPNVCRIYELGFHPSPSDPSAQMYLTMELLPGETLAESLARGPVRTEQAAPLVRQMAEALEAAHNVGVIHRDFKSGNVMLTPHRDGIRAVVMDFGLAGSFDDVEGGKTVTRSGDLAGTPEYMAPEQLAGEAISPATDIYALGIVMYEMVTGRRPFHGRTPFETAVRRLHEPPESPRRFVADIDPRWEYAILRCLSRRPEDRFQRTTALLSALGGEAPGRRSWRAWKSLALIGGLGLTIVVTFAALRLVSRKPLPEAARWQQITSFSDSVTNPALSPDGRMLAFKRGGDWFMSRGQIYVKLLPDGQPVQLTHDAFAKMAPVFSPDGARVAYSVRRPGSEDWEIWQVSVLPGGGEPQLLLRNAEGLIWIDKQHVLFSEIQERGGVMSVVTSTESRTAVRDIYVPRKPERMAHFSALSPDGKKVLIVEMDPASGGIYTSFLPCRLAPMDGSSPGREVGPAHAHCVSAAWSPDGKWMYFSGQLNQKIHLWRQRPDGGEAEQITWGPTDEQGIAIPADGQSAFTSVGVSQSTVWVHDRRGERQISGEGSAGSPKFSADGRGVYYLSAADLWFTDLQSAQPERVLPGVSVSEYALSPDGKAIAYVTADGTLWYGPLDRRTAPHRLALHVTRPEFTRSGDVLFRAASTLYRMHSDGTDRREVPGNPGDSPRRSSSLSPDEKWGTSGVGNGFEFAEPRDGGPRIPLCDRCFVHWSLDGKFFWMSLRGLNGEGVTGLFRLKDKASLPTLPREGVQSSAELTRIPGVQIVSSEAISPAPDGSGYACVRQRGIALESVPHPSSVGTVVDEIRMPHSLAVHMTGTEPVAVRDPRCSGPVFV